MVDLHVLVLQLWCSFPKVLSLCQDVGRRGIVGGGGGGVKEVSMAGWCDFFFADYAVKLSLKKCQHEHFKIWKVSKVSLA